MRKLLMITLGFVLFGVTAQAQILKPVKWGFTAVKKSAGLYELHLTATIDKTWKIYSGGTPEGGPSPTVIKFKPNPLALLGGKVREIGVMHKVDEPAFGVQVFYYTDRVDFVQVVKLKNPGVKTSLSGTVEFMACDDNQCLPPEEIAFKVEIK
jgi:hypothetical protein